MLVLKWCQKRAKQLAGSGPWFTLPGKEVTSKTAYKHAKTCKNDANSRSRHSNKPDLWKNMHVEECFEVHQAHINSPTHTRRDRKLHETSVVQTFFPRIRFPISTRTTPAAWLLSTELHGRIAKVALVGLGTFCSILKQLLVYICVWYFDVFCIYCIHLHQIWR